jgi:hypothetical protein
MNKGFRIVIILLAFAIVGYFREFFFTQLNVILFHVYYKSDYVRPISPIMAPFDKLDYSTLYWLKYLFTALFAGLFLLVNYLSLKFMSARPALIKTLLYTYAVIIIIAGLSMLYGYAVHSALDQEEYTLSRWLMGIAQSPIICLILLASEKLSPKT